MFYYRNTGKSCPTLAQTYQIKSHSTGMLVGTSKDLENENLLVESFAPPLLLISTRQSRRYLLPCHHDVLLQSSHGCANTLESLLFHSTRSPSVGNIVYSLEDFHITKLQKAQFEPPKRLEPTKTLMGPPWGVNTGFSLLRFHPSA